MNSIAAKVLATEQCRELSLVSLRSGGADFLVLVVESANTPDYMHIGAAVRLLFKETDGEIVPKTNFCPPHNCLPCRISCFNRGTLLTELTLQWQEQLLQVLILSKEFDLYQFEAGQEVYLRLRSDELMIQAV